MTYTQNMTPSAAAAKLPDNVHVRPGRSVHNVKPGETLADISSMYGISQTELIRQNAHALGSDGTVHAGMRLEVGL